MPLLCSKPPDFVPNHSQNINLQAYKSVVIKNSYFSVSKHPDVHYI